MREINKPNPKDISVEKSEKQIAFDAIAAEFTHSLRNGNQPSIEQYIERYPEYAIEIRRHFETIRAIENLKAQNPIHSLELEEPELRQIGDYKIIRQIGRGGMGIVYEAIQLSLNRRVAVKVLSATALLNEKHLKRFENEARTTARLHQSHIVPVLGVGKEKNVPYLVMQLIEGISLDQVLHAVSEKNHAIDETEDNLRSQTTISEESLDRLAQSNDRQAPPASNNPIPLNAVLKNLQIYGDQFNGENSNRISLQTEEQTFKPTIDWNKWIRSVALIGKNISEALAYAHKQGILHRDIKPSNLIADQSGKIWLTDFGLAKNQSNRNLSQSGDLVGTLRYMAPEQFIQESDARSDIYGLGITLYELIALSPAHQGEKPGKILKSVSEFSPHPLRSHNKFVPIDLDTIIQKAIAKDPNQRYQTAAHFSEDLDCFLSDRPISARRVGFSERVYRWAKRNPIIASLSSSLILMAVISFLAISYQWRQAVNENQRAEQNLSLALKSIDKILQRHALDWMSHPTVHSPGSSQSPGCIASARSAELVQDSLKFYQWFANKNSSNPRLQEDFAKANAQLGSIYFRLAQYDKAVDKYEVASKIWVESGIEQGEMECFVFAAKALNHQGSAYRQAGRFDLAAKSHSNALNLLKKHLKLASESVQTKFAMAETYNMLGNQQAHANSNVDRNDFQRIAIQTLDELMKADPENPNYRFEAAKAYRNIYWRQRIDSPQDAIISQRKSIELLKQLTEQFPKVPDYICELCEVLTMGVGKFSDHSTKKHSVSNDTVFEEASFLSALTKAEKLVLHYPNIPRYKVATARLKQRLARHYFRNQDQVKKAEQYFNENLATYRTLVRDFPHVDAYKMHEARSSYLLAKQLSNRNRTTEAVELLRSVLKTEETTEIGSTELEKSRESIEVLLRRLEGAGNRKVINEN